MPGILIELREAFFLPIYRDLPPYIKAKIKLIEELYGQAMFYEYEEFTSPVPDFDKYVRRCRQEQKSFQPNPERLKYWISRPLDSSLEKQLEENTAFPYLDDLILMTDPEYEPYTDLFEPGSALIESELGDPDAELIGPGSRLQELAHMLQALWFYWIHPEGRSELESELGTKKSPAVITDFEVSLDLSLAKLALRIGIETSSIRHWKKKKEIAVRVNLGQKIQTNNKVTEAFHQVLKNQGDTLNKIVTRIYNYLIDNEQEDSNRKRRISPGKKTIERTLRANKQLMKKCFKDEIRGQKKRIIYIGHTHI